MIIRKGLLIALLTGVLQVCYGQAAQSHFDAYVDNTMVGENVTKITFDGDEALLFFADQSTMQTDMGSLVILPHEDEPLLLGDVNSDGKITITDAVGIVNYILGNPSSGFNIQAADLNGDHNITITDAVCVVNIIMNAP